MFRHLDLSDVDSIYAHNHGFIVTPFVACGPGDCEDPEQWFLDNPWSAACWDSSSLVMHVVGDTLWHVVDGATGERVTGSVNEASSRRMMSFRGEDVSACLSLPIPDGPVSESRRAGRRPSGA